jgi:hypothetical protein
LVYFMQSVNGGPVKIGTTDYLEYRHDQLEKHYKTSLAILATMEGGVEKEAEIHARFDHLRMGQPGRRGKRPEQFRPDPELMAFIGRPLLAAPDPDAVEMMASEPAQHSIITLKGPPEFKIWLKELADHARLPATLTIDMALKHFAKSCGFEKPMPRRQKK